MRPSLSQAQISAFRARVCQVAERLFAERGVPAVSMRVLAAELGCSATAAYRYFRDKEEILAAVRTAGFDRFASRMEQAAAGAVGARARGLAFGKAHVDFVRDEPNAYRLMYDLTQPDEARYPDLQRASARTARLMADWVEELLAEGIVRGDPGRLAWMFWAASHGVAVLHLAGKTPAEHPLVETQREMMRLLARGTRFVPRKKAAAPTRRRPTSRAGASSTRSPRRARRAT